MFGNDEIKTLISCGNVWRCVGNARYLRWFCALLCESGGRLSGGDHADPFYRRPVTHVAVAQAIHTFGGSPYNAAARFAAGRDDADVVTGVNLPMLVEVLGRRLTGGSLPELVDTARTAGAGGVKVLSEIFTPTTNESDDEGDEL